MSGARRPPPSFTRSPHLVAYWRGDAFVVHNYATGAVAEATALVRSLLDFCGRRRSPSAIRRFVGPADPASVDRLLQRLVTLSFLHRSDRPLDPRENAMRAFARWNPVAGFFHTATKDVRFQSPAAARRAMDAQARTWPMPSPRKRYRAAPVVRLPAPDLRHPLADVLRSRRTWRRFARAPVTRDELATVLGLTMGVQQWVTAGGAELPLKTFPSGGARHPIEAYLLVRDVRGLRPGIYHYAADGHLLERLPGRASAARIRAYLPHSGYFAGASCLVLFTAVFERQLWRYPYARAYRAALVEAGHACQNFCLVATALRLAPFSVMGLADSTIERDLRLDGVGETVLYAAGVGRPPAGSSWAPVTHGALPVRRNPALSPR